MRKMIVTFSILGVMFLTFANAVPAFAEEESPERPWREYIVLAFAEALGLDPAELQGRLDAGENLIAIAAEHGIEVDDFTAFVDEVVDAAIVRAVNDGVITQEQADRIRARWEHLLARRENVRRRRFWERILNRLGITREEWVKYRESGMTLGEIAESLGIEISRPFGEGGIFGRLGLTREEVRQRRAAGETIREILESEGFDFSVLGGRVRSNRR